MVPDLPYVRKDVPDDSEGPDTTGRFAKMGRSSELREPSTSEGNAVRPLPAQNRGRYRRPPRAAHVGGGRRLCTAVSLSLTGELAAADDLTDRREELKAQIASTRSSLSESSAALRRAAVAVDRTQSQLEAAKAALAETRRALAVAAERDRLMAAKLARAQAELARAKAAVVVGPAEARRPGCTRRARSSATSTSSRPICCRSRSWSRAARTADLQTRLQWSTTLFDTAADEIDRLTVLRRQLEVARVKAAALERQVAADRKVAADNLAATRVLERRAADSDRERDAGC